MGSTPVLGVTGIKNGKKSNAGYNSQVKCKKTANKKWQSSIPWSRISHNESRVKTQ